MITVCCLLSEPEIVIATVIEIPETTQVFFTTHPSLMTSLGPKALLIGISNPIFAPIPNLKIVITTVIEIPEAVRVLTTHPLLMTFLGPKTLPVDISPPISHSIPTQNASDCL